MSGVGLTGDELDAMAASCGACWAHPGESCRVVHVPTLPPEFGRYASEYGRYRRPHRARIERARRRGALGGVGRALLERGT
jgi:hypothetical protein